MVLPVFISSSALLFIALLRSTILKEIAIHTREKQTKRVVIILRIKTSLPTCTKIEENTVNNWHSKKMGMNKKRTFMEIYLRDDNGAVFITQREYPSETIAG
jgi:hypothetical protein